MYLLAYEELFPKTLSLNLGIAIGNPSFGMAPIAFWKRALLMYVCVCIYIYIYMKSSFPKQDLQT